MAEQPESLDARLSAIERTLTEVERRLRVLEQDSLPQSVGQFAAGQAWAPSAGASATDVVGTFTLIGRTFVVFAGAYLLRALTESGALHRTTGVALGLAYAFAWTILAYRVAPRHALSATFYGACTVLVGFPLVWEATTRFALLTPAAGAATLSGTTGVVLLTAWRRDLHALAWIAMSAACALASLLLVTTGAPVPFASFLIALGIATLWLGYERDWTLLRWVAAFFADIAVLGLTGRALATPPRDDPSQVMGVQLLLLVGYLASIGVRTLVRGRDVIPFEAAQTSAMLVAGLAGALLIGHRTGVGVIPLGLALLALAVGCYAVEFVDRRQTRGANRYFYTSLALVFALTGSELLLDGTFLGTLWVLLAVFVAWAGRHYGRTTLAVHSVVYVTAAALSSGLIATTFTGLFASVNGSWNPVGPAAWAVLVALGLCWLVSTPRSGTSVRVAHVMRVLLAILVVVTVTGVCIVVIRSTLPLGIDASLYAGIVATLRTGVLAGAALAVAWFGRRIATRELGVLLYPVLAWGAVKLLIEDFRTSPPLLLVVAFALYGGALILAPRIARYE